jgi:hypothetical protein
MITIEKREKPSGKMRIILNVDLDESMQNRLDQTAREEFGITKHDYKAMDVTSAEFENITDNAKVLDLLLFAYLDIFIGSRTVSQQDGQMNIDVIKRHSTITAALIGTAVKGVEEAYRNLGKQL